MAFYPSVHTWVLHALFIISNGLLSKMTELLQHIMQISFDYSGNAVTGNISPYMIGITLLFDF